MSIGRNAKTCVNHNHWSTDYKFDSTMNFTTIMLGHKKGKLGYKLMLALLETQIDSICEHDSDGDHIYGTFQIDFTSWNGEELFYLKDSGAIVCSLRVKELIERHNISNVSFEGLDKY